jgi:hypothetical protein
VGLAICFMCLLAFLCYESCDLPPYRRDLQRNWTSYKGHSIRVFAVVISKFPEKDRSYFPERGISLYRTSRALPSPKASLANQLRLPELAL